MKSNPIFLRMVAMAVMLGLASCDLFNGGIHPTLNLLTTIWSVTRM